jgi:hypothetical protein
MNDIGDRQHDERYRRRRELDQAFAARVTLAALIAPARARGHRPR